MSAMRVAFVVADTVEQARDAIEAIDVEWTPLPAVAGVANALTTAIGDRAATDAAFASAHAVAEITVVNPRIVTNYMEPRAAVAE